MSPRNVAAHVSQTVGRQDFATLVRGEDRFGHFLPCPALPCSPPKRDMDPEAVAFHPAAAQSQREILYQPGGAYLAGRPSAASASAAVSP